MSQVAPSPINIGWWLLLLPLLVRRRWLCCCRSRWCRRWCTSSKHNLWRREYNWLLRHNHWLMLLLLLLRYLCCLLLRNLSSCHDVWCRHRVCCFCRTRNRSRNWSHLRHEHLWLRLLHKWTHKRKAWCSSRCGCCSRIDHHGNHHHDLLEETVEITTYVRH